MLCQYVDRGSKKLFVVSVCRQGLWRVRSCVLCQYVDGMWRVRSCVLCQYVTGAEEKRSCVLCQYVDRNLGQ